MTLLAAVPALLAVVHIESLERDRARERTLTDNLRLARLAADGEAGQFDGARRLLVTLTEFPQIQGNDSRACSQVLAHLLHSHQIYVNLSVANADGTVFCSGAPFNPSLVARATGRQWFDDAVRTRTTAVGEVKMSAVTGKPSIIVAQPLLGDHGEVRRVIAATISVDQLRRAVSPANLPSGATVTLFDATGTIILRAPDGDRWIGRRIPDAGALHRLEAGATEDVTDTVGVDGVRRVYATVPIHASFPLGMYLGLGILGRSARWRTNLRAATDQSASTSH
jgi:hypothetical protein